MSELRLPSYQSLWGTSNNGRFCGVMGHKIGAVSNLIFDRRFRIERPQVPIMIATSHTMRTSSRPMRRSIPAILAAPAGATSSTPAEVKPHKFNTPLVNVSMIWLNAEE